MNQPSSPPGAGCPKCGTPRTDAEACARCGVIFARFDESVLEEGVPPEVLALWGHVEAHWEDRARHALFVERALAAGAAGYAASRYRRRQPDPMADEQLGRIQERLELLLGAMSTRPSAADPPGSGRRLWLGMILLLMAAAAVALFLATRAGAPAPVTPDPPAPAGPRPAAPR